MNALIFASESRGRPRRASPVSDAAAGRWLTLGVLALASFLLLLGDTSLNVVLPQVGDDLNLGLRGLEWLVNTYTLALAVVLLPAGKAADRFGARRVFLVGIAIFVSASTLAGLAPDAVTLLAARLVQGIGAALATPAALSLITVSFDGRRRGAALGVWTAAATSAVAIGPLVGALLSAVAGWRAVLFINAPLGLGVLVAARRLLPDTAGRAAAAFDATGLATSAFGLSALVYGLSSGADWGWSSPRLLVTLAAAASSLALFVVIEARARRPLLDLDLFRRRSFAGANVVGLLVTAVMCSVFFFLALYLQGVAGYTTLGTGVLFLALTVPIALVAPVAGLLVDRSGARLPLAAGSVPVAAGLLLLAIAAAPLDRVLLLIALLLIGIGMGLTTTPLTAAAVAGLAPEESGSGAAVVNTFRTVGLALGIALMGTLLRAGSAGTLSAALPRALAVNAVLALVAGVIGALTVDRVPRAGMHAYGMPRPTQERSAKLGNAAARRIHLGER